MQPNVCSTVSKGLIVELQTIQTNGVNSAGGQLNTGTASKGLKTVLL
jgi:hypothetical protein